jgi:hypothetical protein
MVIALAFFKRTFRRSLPMNQAHGLIIAEAYGTLLRQHEHRSAEGPGSASFARSSTCFMSSSFVSVVNEPKSMPASAHFLGAEIRSDRQSFLLVWGVPRVRLQHQPRCLYLGLQIEFRMSWRTRQYVRYQARAGGSGIWISGCDASWYGESRPRELRASTGFGLRPSAARS